jgi:arylsulfatase A-like enzyme
MKPQNLLFITADQWRGECLSTLGHPVVKTPNLDNLAFQGLLFKNHYAQCTPCGPSRASLYTGMYLQNHRSIHNGTPLDARHTNIALEMRKLGYTPVLAGYTDTTADPRRYALNDPVLKTYEGILPGFSKVLAAPSTSFPEPWARWLVAKGYRLPPNIGDLYFKSVQNYPGAEQRGKTYSPACYSKDESDTAFLTDQALQYIRYPAPEPYSKMYHPDDVPTFFSCSSVEDEKKQHPYLDFLLDKNLNIGNYRSENYPRDEASMRQLRATYYGLMTEVDDNIGRIVDLLKETGQYDQTTIVFTSDHGDQLGDHWLLGKGSYFDSSFHIPLIIRIPDDSSDSSAQKIGRTIEEFTENIDILPTLLDLFGGEIPRQCDGYSLLPFFTSDFVKGWRSEVHWELDFGYFDEYPNVLPGKELGLAYEECVFNVIRDDRYKYVHFAAMPPLFYDIKNDPAERYNLADDDSYTELMLEYVRKLLSWRMKNDERILTDLRVGPKGLEKSTR